MVSKKLTRSKVFQVNQVETWGVKVNMIPSNYCVVCDPQNVQDHPHFSDRTEPTKLEVMQDLTITIIRTCKSNMGIHLWLILEIAEIYSS